MTGDDTRFRRVRQFVSYLRRADGPGVWGSRVSGWAGLLVGVAAYVLTEQFVAASVVPGGYAPAVLLVLIYAGLGLAAAAESRFGRVCGPATAGD